MGVVRPLGLWVFEDLTQCTRLKLHCIFEWIVEQFDCAIVAIKGM